MNKPLRSDRITVEGEKNYFTMEYQTEHPRKIYWQVPKVRGKYLLKERLIRNSAVSIRRERGIEE